MGHDSFSSDTTVTTSDSLLLMRRDSFIWDVTYSYGTRLIRMGHDSLDRLAIMKISSYVITYDIFIKVGLGILQITSAKRCPHVWPWVGRSLFSTNFVEFDQAV